MARTLILALLEGAESFPNIKTIIPCASGVEFCSLCGGSQSLGYGALRDGGDQRLSIQHKPKHHNPIQPQPTRPNWHEDQECWNIGPKWCNKRNT